MRSEHSYTAFLCFTEITAYSYLFLFAIVSVTWEILAELPVVCESTP